MSLLDRRPSLDRGGRVSIFIIGDCLTDWRRSVTPWGDRSRLKTVPVNAHAYIATDIKLT